METTILERAAKVLDRRYQTCDFVIRTGKELEIARGSKYHRPPFLANNKQVALFESAVF